MVAGLARSNDFPLSSTTSDFSEYAHFSTVVDTWDSTPLPAFSVGSTATTAAANRPVQRQTMWASGSASSIPRSSRISETGGAKFWFHGLRNCFITVAERELMLPPSLTKRLVNHARPMTSTGSRQPVRAGPVNYRRSLV